MTDAGREHYATHLATYRGLYDDVDAPDEWMKLSGTPPR